MSTYELSNLLSRKSGLSHMVWISVRGKNKYGPRIKVCVENKQNNYFVTISDTPRWGEGDDQWNFDIPLKFDTPLPRGITQKQVGDIIAWVQLNKAPLIEYWERNGDNMDTLDLFMRLSLCP